VQEQKNMQNIAHQSGVFFLPPKTCPLEERGHEATYTTFDTSLHIRATYKTFYH
jgi:hypothetical protein